MKKFEDEFERDMRFMHRAFGAVAAVGLVVLAGVGWAVYEIVTWLVSK